MRVGARDRRGMPGAGVTRSSQEDVDMSTADDVAAEFIAAACVPVDASHASGTRARADEILARHPEVAGHSIHTAAVLGDEGGVRRFLETDPANATEKGGPHGWDALTHLCF